MEYIIAALKSPGPELLKVGPIIVKWYGILIAISVLIGLNLSNALANQRKLYQGLINDLMPILILSSLIGARFYYVCFEWGKFSGINFWTNLNLLGFQIQIPRFLAIWNGGIAIHGALIFGSISVIIFCRFKSSNIWDTLDVLLPSVALGQAIGRWGNFFNNEAFGIPTKLPWKLFIPYSLRPEGLENQLFFHPTFLYESIWNLFLFLILISLFQMNRRNLIKLSPGVITCIYLIIYSLGRFWIEGLRTDSLCFGSLPPACEGGIRIAQMVSFLMICLGAFGLWWIYHKKRKLPRLGIISKR